MRGSKHSCRHEVSLLSAGFPEHQHVVNAPMAALVTHGTPGSAPPRSPEPSAADKAAWKAAGAKLWDEYAAADKYSKELIDVLRKEQK